jgi:7,8-dihydro-6-hydroxymethylpterin-pyrophosphokinase
MLKFIKWIEKKMGRVESFRNAPRLIDIDILFYNDIALTSDELQIPHPRLHERAFVLVPLVEIAADMVHPILNITVEEMLRRVEPAGVRRVERSLRL